MSSWKPVALSAIQPRHLSLGATMVESNGWRLPAHYSTAEKELQRLREFAGACDISPKGKLVLHGEIDTYVAGALKQGGPSETGTVGLLDHPGGRIVMARLAADEALLVTNIGQAGELAGLLHGGDTCSHAVDMTSVLAGIAIAGPRAQHVLAALTEMDTSPAAFPNLSCAQGTVAEVHGTLLRVDRGSVPGYELYFGRDYGEYMWDAVLEAGGSHGLAPAGAQALAELNA